MINSIEVPKNLMGSFKRVARRIPVGLKNDEDLVKTIVAYLQLGGEKLARQAVEAAKRTLELEVAQKKKKAREEALIRAAEARLAAADAESGESDEEFDDENDDDDDEEY
jgi:hypothetical protein